MKKLIFSVIGCLVIGTAALALAMGESSDYKRYSWRYKMTVEVDTPEGVKTGSAVREIHNNLSGSPLSQQGNPGDIIGEAVVVDLGKRGVLFALISDQSDNRFSENFPLPGRIGGQGSTTPEGIKYQSSLPIGTKAVLNPHTPQGYPKLVTFTDINDPKSVKLIQEWERNRKARLPFNQQRTLKIDRLEELFGKGVRIKNITIEITDEPVAWGVVDRHLKWIHNYHNQLFDGRKIHTYRAENKLANSLGAGSFTTRKLEE